jgi:hypothetical protein
MRRDIIVEKLIAEGLSVKTLVKLNDKQLNELADRMLGETITTTMAAIQKSPSLQAAAKDKAQTLNVVGEEDVTEDLTGKRKNIDKNDNGKIDAEDFKILRGEKKKKKSKVVKKTEDVKEWVMSLAENELYHNFTSKNEIIELIQNKLNESKKVAQDNFMDVSDIKNVITNHLQKNK